jgi:hypothetical protein
MMDVLITIYSIDGMHIALTETGENGSIQPQLITPPTWPTARRRPPPVPAAGCHLQGAQGG